MTLTQPVNVPTPDEMLRAQDGAGVECVGGEIVEKQVSNISSFVARRISLLLGQEADRTGTAWVYESSMGFQCFPEEPGKFRKPDVSIVLTERLKELPPEFGLMPIPADLAVQVNSPNDFASVVEAKVDEYLEADFAIVCVVDPPTRTVTIHRADGSVSRLHADDEISGETAWPTFKCKVAEFFRTPA